MDFVLENESCLHLIFKGIGVNSSNGRTIETVLRDLNENYNARTYKKFIIIIIHLKLYKSLLQMVETNPSIRLNDTLYKMFSKTNLISVVEKLRQKTGLVMPSVEMSKKSVVLLLIFIGSVSTLMITFFYFFEIAFLVIFTFFTPIIFFIVGSVFWFLLKKWLPGIFSVEKFSEVHTYLDFLNKTYDLNGFLYNEERIKQDLFFLKSIDSHIIKQEVEKLANILH